MTKIPSFRHFELSEFACECGFCDGENWIEHDFVRRLDHARESATCPFVIISGYRCEDHPESIKNPTSSHSSCAADIATPDSHTRFLIMRSLIEHGFHRIGVNRGTIHVDGDESKPGRMLWTYYKDADDEL